MAETAANTAGETQGAATGIFGKLGPAAAGIGAVAGTFLGIRSLAEVPPWAVKLIETRGLDYVLAVLVVILGAYFLQAFVKAQQAIAVALAKISVVIDRTAGEETRQAQLTAECLVNDRIMVSRVADISREVQDVQSAMTMGFGDLRKLISNGQKIS